MAGAPLDAVVNGTISDSEAPVCPASGAMTEENANSEDEEVEEDPEECPDEEDPDEAVVEVGPALAAEAEPTVHDGGGGGGETDADADADADAKVKKWPGWPGDNVFRLIVPVLTVGSIIGRKGELIKKLCEETRARVRILKGPLGVSDRIVLVSGKEELEAEKSPAMNAVLRIFKHVHGILNVSGDGTNSGSSTPGICSVRLLVASSQAIDLIGKKGEVIKSIRESSDATVHILTGGDLPFYVDPDERIVVIRGEPFKVLTALEAVVWRLRKFLVDHSILPMFEKNCNTPAAHDQSVDTLGGNTNFTSHMGRQATISSDYDGHFKRKSNDYDIPLKRGSFSVDYQYSFDSKKPRSRLELYGQDPSISDGYYSAPRTGSVLEIVQRTQIPLEYAEVIIGTGGDNIAYIRRASGALVTVQETRGLPNEITLEIKGTSSEVHVAQELIQERLVGSRELVSHRYRGPDRSLQSSYLHLSDASYASSSIGSQSYRRYDSYAHREYAAYRS